MQVIEGLDEVLGASAPAAQLRDEDGIDLVGLSERHHLGALPAIILGAGGGLLEHADDLVAGALGEGAQIALLAVARLVVGADAAVDGNLSQLNPLRFRLLRSQQKRAFRCVGSVSNTLLSNKAQFTSYGGNLQPVLSAAG